MSFRPERVLMWANVALAASAGALWLHTPGPLLAGASIVAGCAAIGLWFADRWERV